MITEAPVDRGPCRTARVRRAQREHDMYMIVETAIVREIDAETIGSPTATGRLLLDSDDTGGALSTVRMTLAEGADGAVPHHHATSTELFYILQGKARILSGEEIVT